MRDWSSSSSPLDPVANVLLDYQSVMAQFLELQRQVIGTLVSGRSHGRLPHALHVSIPSFEAPAPPLPSSSGDAGPGDTRTSASEFTSVDSPFRFEHAGFSRHSLTVRSSPRGQARAGLAPGHTIVFSSDDRGIATLAAQRLRRDGWRVATISAEVGSGPEPDLFKSSLDSVEEVERVVHGILESCGPIGAFIHLGPLSSAPPLDVWDVDFWWSRLSSESRTLFLLAKALGGRLEQAARTGGAALIAATSMGGTFGTQAADAVTLPSQGGVVGLTKCLALEWPEVRVRAVDLDLTEPFEDVVQHVIDELWSMESSPEIGYVQGRRVSVDVVSSPARLDPSFDVPSDAVVLATGGARGITAEVCVDLAKRYQPTFVLVGRSPLPPPIELPDTAAAITAPDVKRALIVRLKAEGVRVTPAMVEKSYRSLLKEREIRDTISRLSAAGARTHYVQADVEDAQTFGSLIEDLYAAYGRLDGVIHGAGVIEDKLVRDKTVDSFDRVLRTKAMSAFVLSRQLRPETLRFVVFFTSVAGRFGNRGQADYAAANEAVSKLAVVLGRRWPVRVCAIAWAPWDRAGMVSPELKREFARRGVALLAPAEGRRALWEEIQQGPHADVEVVIGGAAHAPLSLASRSERLPLLKHATQEQRAGDVVRFVRPLDPSVDVYLNDHRLDGRPVLPLAFAAELMAEAAQAARPDLRVVGVRDLQLLKGIVVAPAPLWTTITVRDALEQNESGLTEVHVDISTPAISPPVRYRSVVQLAVEAANAPAFSPPAMSLERMPKSLERAYREWTFHGPLFQRVTDIAGIGDAAMLGTVYSSSAIPVIASVSHPEWIIDPFVFDAALQLLLMWSRAKNDMTALPSRFRSLTSYRPLSDQRVTCYVAVESLASGHALRSTVQFVDDDGRILAVLDAVEATCTATLNRLADVPSGTAR